MTAQKNGSATLGLHAHIYVGAFGGIPVWTCPLVPDVGVCPDPENAIEVRTDA